MGKMKEKGKIVDVLKQKTIHYSTFSKATQCWPQLVGFDGIKQCFATLPPGIFHKICGQHCRKRCG